MKKLLCLLTSILLLVSLAVSAFAAEEPSEGSGETSPTTHTHSWNAETTPATCTTAGTKTSTCSGCGEVVTETLAATGHSYGGWTQTSDGHSRACGTCGAEDTGSHSMTSQVTTQPTCKDKGVKTHSCSVCGYSYTEEVPVSSTHTYGDWTGDEKTHTRSCSVCGQTDSGSHSWGSGSTILAATCKDEGVRGYPCSGCDLLLLEAIPKLTTHTYDTVCDPDCNVCGAVRETEHKFSTVWSKSWKEHWHACTRCGEKADIADHYPGPAATEEKDQICLTCGYVMTPKLNHTHKYSAEWSSDEGSHWYACEGCEDQKDFAYHEYDDLCDPDCSVCGYTTPTAHSYDETWLSDETGHWTVCVLCGEEREAEAHTPDPEVSETEAQLCTVCGFEIAPAQVHVHESGDAWLTDGENHWKTCECGEELDKASHDWDEGTENADTTVTYVCTECGAEKTEGEPKIESGFPWGIVLAVLIVVAVGLVVALIVLLRADRKNTGKFAK